jgi:glycine cleavage system H protein
MPDFLEVTVDKFTFKVAADRLYTPAGVWAFAEGLAEGLAEENRIRIGLSDFQQQRSGDVAFAEVQPVGTLLAFDDEAAVVETIKVNISLGSPAAGKVVEANPAMSDAPDVINQDPYGEGWIAVIEAVDWKSDQARLLSPQAYFNHIKALADQETKKT